MCVAFLYSDWQLLHPKRGPLVDGPRLALLGKVAQPGLAED